MNYAVIDPAGLVVNIILWDGASAYDPGAGNALVQSAAANIGDSYADGVFTPPADMQGGGA